MPKRRQTTSPHHQNHILDDIKIKIEKDCEEEESIVVQNFQLASSFDETNKIKKENEINFELIVEDKEESNEKTQGDPDDGSISNDEVESISENSNQKLNEKETQIKLEPEEYCEDEGCADLNSQELAKTIVNTSYNAEDIKEELMIIKEEIEDFGVDLVKIEIKITKVDMEVAEPYAKKLRLSQESRRSSRGKTVSEKSTASSKSASTSKKNDRSAKSSTKLTESESTSKSSYSKNDENSEDSDQSNEHYYDDMNGRQSSISCNSDSNSEDLVANSTKSSNKANKLEKSSPKTVQKASRQSKSSTKSTSNAKTSKLIPQFNSSTKAVSDQETSFKNDRNQQKEDKYFKIFDQCKLQSQKSAKSSCDTKNSINDSKIPQNSSKPALPEAKPSKSSLKNSNSIQENPKPNSKNSKRKSTLNDTSQQNSFELCSRLSIEDTKDPRLAALFNDVPVKKEQNSKLKSNSSNDDLTNPEIMKLHEMHLDALGLGAESPALNINSHLVPSTSKKSSKSDAKKDFQCKLCPKSFDKRISLFNHKAAHTSYDYPCLKCGLKFKTLRAFKNHECPICEYCGKKFKNKPKLIRHVTYVHSEKSNLELFTCDICGKAVKYKVSIERHMIEHLEVTKNLRYKCEICNKTFKKRMGLHNHQIIHVFATLSCKKCGMTFKKQKPFEQHKCLNCTHCPKNFSSKTKLNDHIRNIHTDKSQLNLFVCDFCGKSFKYRPSIIRHVLDHREEAKYKCEVCGKKWKSDISLRDHIRMCHATELTTCKICFKQMKPQCIYQHMKYVHSTVRDFKCKICDADFKTKEKLKRHLDTHNRKFNCDQCDRKFSSQYELTEHLKWHEDPNIFKCNICKKSFATRTSLTTHSKLHKGIVRNLKCPHCPFTTHRKESIKYHLTTHEKRDKKLEMKKNWLKCEKCGALLKNKASLWGHHRKVHPTERFTCDFCGIIVKTKHSLKHHIDIKHMGK